MPKSDITPPPVTLEQHEELPLLRIRNPHAEALIALQGAQLLTFTPHGERPLIWLSERAQFRRGASIRGGIPVCWPWFGELARNPVAVRGQVAAGELPAHGLVRAQPWLLERIETAADATAVTLRYPIPAGLLPHWFHAAELALTLRVGRTLQLQLETRNAGSAPLSLSQALHTYLAVSDVRAVALHGLEGSSFIDTLRDWQAFTQRGAVHVGAEVDRIYREVPAQLSLRDPGWGRTLQLRTRHSHSAVVWNPWVDKSLRLTQFAPDAWQRMLCIENANVLEDAVTLAPGDSHTLEVKLWSEALPD